MKDLQRQAQLQSIAETKVKTEVKPKLKPPPIKTPYDLNDFNEEEPEFPALSPQVEARKKK